MIPVSPRPISAEELAVLRAALERCPKPPAFEGDRASLDALTVTSRCECGCASVDFIEGDRPQTRPLAEGTAKTLNGGDVGVIVWGGTHSVTALEIYDLGAGEGQGLPVPESIMPWRGEGPNPVRPRDHDVEAVPNSVPDPQIPLVLRGARVFLILSMIAWALGTIQATYHLADAVGGAESNAELTIDLRVLGERTVLFIAAAFAYVAIRRRQVAARWITLGLALFVIYRVSHPAWDAWRAAVLGEFDVAPPAIAYSSREEGAIALIMNVAMIGYLLILAVQMVIGPAVRRYFDARRA